MDGLILLEEDVERGSVCGGDELDGVAVDAGGFERCGDDFCELLVAVDRFFAATQDAGVA